MSEHHPFQPDYAFPPGETLLETLEELGLTQKELAERMGRPLKTINQIVKGTAQIMPDTALQLEKVTGVPASFWNNAESNYRESLARLADQKRLESEVDWVDRFSYTKMANLNLLPSAKDKIERVYLLLRYFSVASPKQWETTYGGLCGLARESGRYQTDLGDLSAWLRAGERLAQKRDCQAYDKDTFLKNLADIRSLTRQDPSRIWSDVCQLCAASGVAVALVPELPKTHVSGFTRWLAPDKALIQLSLRYKTDDQLWFTFFHEAAHILLHGKREVFVEYRDIDNPKEREANQWAGSALIPDTEWKRFCQSINGIVSATKIDAFAKHLGIATGIVVGRLQKEKRIPFTHHNKFKRRLEIAWKGLDQ